LAKKLYFLGDEDVKMPVGGEFTPSGFIGAVSAKVLYVVSYTAVQLPWSNTDGFKVASKDGSKTSYYFLDPAKASAAVKAAGGREAGVYNASETWRFEIERKNILNKTDDILAKFKELVSFEVDIRGLTSKDRANFHMISLPMAVQAAALYFGYITERVFSIDELTRQDTIYTDEFEASYIGSPDAKKPDEEHHYTKSTLWQRRADLWKALGEPNPAVFAVNSARKEMNATSEMLIDCLNVTNKSWTAPAFSRLITVADPHMGATFESGGETVRKNVPALWEIYADKAAAVAAAHEEMERFGTATGTVPTNGSTPATGGAPALPGDWGGMLQDFTDALSEAVGEGKSNPVIAKEMDIKVAEVKTWREFLKL
jgi:hypothetical protein